jgi:hypothetical protein
LPHYPIAADQVLHIAAFETAHYGTAKRRLITFDIHMGAEIGNYSTGGFSTQLPRIQITGQSLLLCFVGLLLVQLMDTP